MDKIPPPPQRELGDNHLAQKEVQYYFLIKKQMCHVTNEWGRKANSSRRGEKNKEAKGTLKMSYFMGHPKASIMMLNFLILPLS